MPGRTVIQEIISLFVAVKLESINFWIKWTIPKLAHIDINDDRYFKLHCRAFKLQVSNELKAVVLRQHTGCGLSGPTSAWKLSFLLMLNMTPLIFRATALGYPVIFSYLVLIKWIGHFLKVAHILPLEASASAVDAENFYESVYTDMRQQVDLTPFTIPNSWKQLWKDVEPAHNFALIDHHSSINGSQYSDIPSQIDTGFDGTFLDDDFLSAISSFKGEWTSADTSMYGVGFPTSTTGNCMLPSASSTVNMELPTPVPVRTEAEYNVMPPDVLTFLLAPTTDIALASSAVPTLQYEYVMCDPDDFARGISYTNESLQSTFPKASACIRDASILAKQWLTINGSQQNSFCTGFINFIVEMVTVAKHAGHSVEQGIKCQVTNKTIALDMVHNERYKSMKFLKENCFTFAEDLWKKALGGYCLGDYHDGTVGPYINQLTGVTAWDDKVTNLSFACSSGKYYRWMSILVILTLRILQPLRSQHRSLLDLFPAQYEKLPEHLIASACRMYTIFFRHQLPGYPTHAKISSEAFEREAAHHLELLRSIRRNTDNEAHRLNNALHLVNQQCGPG
ncbi:hypothetical protein BDR07DRAFT_1377581 [Suillus spraguei]|nr:hypothetical protein BDR07DRAFT_1377581 [Suillus spraguei]